MESAEDKIQYFRKLIQSELNKRTKQYEATGQAHDKGYADALRWVFNTIKYLEQQRGQN